MFRPGTLLKGLLSAPFEGFRNPHCDSIPATAEVAYSRFLRFLKLCNTVIPGLGLPNVIAELGPGSSLGFGLAALIAGGKRYYAFDLIKQFSPEKNLEIFDGLVELFKNRTPIPNDGWCARTFPFADGLAFPGEILDDNRLFSSLAPDRLKRLRRDLEQQTGETIQFFSPWQKQVADFIEKPDWIVSNSVLEHVDDLESAYRAFASWSKSGTVMCHLIDYSSHGVTTVWNEHWRFSDAFWKILRGKRHYFINRLPNERHLSYLTKYKFKLIEQRKLRRVDGFVREEFSKPFQNIQIDDALTHLAVQISITDQG